ncbi:MAG: tetratricopeptide repeat protein [Bacteroidota bacterium]
MENLKSISRITLICSISLLMFFGTSKAQDYAALQKAFSESYVFEGKAEYSKAVETLKKVYDEKSYETNVRIGWLLYMSGLFTESTTFYQKAINLLPLSIEARLGYVNPAAALGNWDMVKTQYEEILKIDPQNSTVNYRMGNIYYGKKDYNTALKYFEKVVNLYPFDYDSVIMYAWSNFKVGKLREAKVLFNKALMNKPTDASAKEGLSLIK